MTTQIAVGGRTRMSVGIHGEAAARALGSTALDGFRAMRDRSVELRWSDGEFDADSVRTLRGLELHNDETGLLAVVEHHVTHPKVGFERTFQLHGDRSTGIQEPDFRQEFPTPEAERGNLELLGDDRQSLSIGDDLEEEDTVTGLSNGADGERFGSTQVSHRHLSMSAT